MSGIAVGFSPVPQANAVVSAGVAAPSEADNPLGFLGALLDSLMQGVSVPPVVGGTVTPDVSLAALADAGLTLTAPEIVVPELDVAAPQAVVPEADPQPTSDDLLNQLVTALAALDQAVADGRPVDPALKKKLTETLDALAGLLGIQLPAPPTIDPAITAAGNVTGEAAADLDPLLEIAKAAAPATNAPTPPAAATDAPDVPPAPGFDALLKAAGLTTAPGPTATVAANAPAPTDTTPAQATAAPAHIAPDSPLGKVVQKLADLAATLKQKSPDLALKLDAIAQKLAAGEVNAAALTKLAATTKLDAETVEALLAPKPASKPAPTPQMFVAPSLVVPEAVAVAPKQAPQPAQPVDDAPAPAKPDEADKPEAPKLSLDARPVDKKDAAEPHAPARSSFAHAMNEAKPDQPTNTQQAAPAAAAQVKTDLGIVAPKMVHAAYQAPVQQVNLPQVAFEVVRQFQQGQSRFQIRLDPPELGRIDVHMRVDREGNVNARMTVERSETLDLMQRDQRSLEKALAQAGLDSSKTNLEFSLRQNPFAREEGGNGRGNGSPFGGGRDDKPAGDEAPEISTISQYRGSASKSGVNLFV